LPNRDRRESRGFRYRFTGNQKSLLLKGARRRSETMTSIEIPYSIAAALPTLSVLDITNDVKRSLAGSEYESGVALVSPREERALVRINERESGIFEDFETLLERLVPYEQAEREALLTVLLGPRGEQIPFFAHRFQLGEWQRILLVSFDGGCEPGWQLTLIGEREEA
jgi:thiamine phosphate synthase YjbQ (UPF0047 family)